MVCIYEWVKEILIKWRRRLQVKTNLHFCRREQSFDRGHNGSLRAGQNKGLAELEPAVDQNNVDSGTEPTDCFNF